MKKSKGKGFDAKVFFLNHGEKLGAGLIALLSLMGLASASWFGADRTVGEMQKIADDTKRAMESPQNTWPETDQESFNQTPNVSELVARMSAPNKDVDQFAPSIAFNPPLNPVREKRGAVLVLSPVSPEQTAISQPIALVDVDEDEEEALDNPADPEGSDGKPVDEESDEDKRRRERFGALAGTGTGGAGMGSEYGSGLGGPGLGLGGGPGLGGAGLGGPGLGGPGLGGPGMGMGGPGMGMGDPGSGGDMYGDGYGGGEMYGDMYGEGGMYGGMLGTNIKEKRIRFAAGVSVRYVFDLREQTKKIADALHIPASDPRAARYAEDFVEIHVERKQALASLDPWAGEWEPVLVEDLAEILEESLGFDLEIVDPRVTRPVITMPLPRLAQGRWSNSQASHKLISDFELSEEEKELVRKRDEKLAQEAAERKAKMPPARAEKKGFSGYKGNANELFGDLYGNGGGEDFYNDVMGEYGSDMMGAGMMGSAPGIQPGKGGKVDEEKLKEMRRKLFETPAGRLLLVRFMDFTVERGQQYIYRIRLELNNPNFNVPVDQLEQPELSSQKTIMSEWSVPTAPVFVPSEYRYYVNKVAGQTGERADVSVYYEAQSLGTPVMVDLQVPVGVRIGGHKETDAVDLSKSVLDRVPVEVKSRDILCGVSEGGVLNGSEHPDLKAFLGRSSHRMADQITVLTPNGSLATRSVGDADRERNEDKGDIEFLIKEYEKIGWRKSDMPDPGNDPFGDYGGEMGSGGYDGGMGYGDPLSGGSRRDNRRGRGRGGRSGGMGGMSGGE
ncbi:MAG: hypothetical protein KDA91_08490 [Planctomycetaceae bacterium]|nr:hypothetical protein [Planctomycetaceae bacterium]